MKYEVVFIDANRWQTHTALIEAKSEAEIEKRTVIDRLKVKKIKSIKPITEGSAEQ